VDDEGVNWFILIRPHQDGTAISTSVLDRRTKGFPHGRGVVHGIEDHRRWNDPEGPLWKGAYHLEQFQMRWHHHGRQL
jgi:hypothetical protein